LASGAISVKTNPTATHNASTTSRFMSFPPRPKYSQGFSPERQDIFPRAGLQSRAALSKGIASATCNVLPRRGIPIREFSGNASMLSFC
jgi:hypothetical protein